MYHAQKQKIIGITVGVGSPYAELASLAALCFTKHTGISALVLGQKEFEISGLAHPAALRLRLFDFVDADAVVYFDADWLCIQDWSIPAHVDAPGLLACRDFILTEEWPRQQYEFESKSFHAPPTDVSLEAEPLVLRRDYIHEIQSFADLKLPCSKWINSGLLIMNRKHHKVWLDTALELYLGSIGHHPIYFEQPALIKAIELLDLFVCLLPRKLNVLAAFEVKWPSSVVGLHIKVKRHAAFLSKVREGVVGTPQQVQDYFRVQ